MTESIWRLFIDNHESIVFQRREDLEDYLRGMKVEDGKIIIVEEPTLIPERLGD